MKVFSRIDSVLGFKRFVPIVLKHDNDIFPDLLQFRESGFNTLPASLSYSARYSIISGNIYPVDNP